MKNEVQTIIKFLKPPIKTYDITALYWIPTQNHLVSHVLSRPATLRPKCLCVLIKYTFYLFCLSFQSSLGS